jgi:uncharacterized protein
VIKLAPKLWLPNEAVTQTFLILGKRGSGKTNTAVVLVEEMVKLAPVVILDPIDAWWGLKSSFAGDEEGLKVYVFGGPHADLPLDPDGGELMARLFIEHRISMVLSMKGWSVGQRARFVTGFCTYLLNHNNRVPVHVVLEEADAFIPQRPQQGEEAMLGATDRLIRWGRMDGIGATAISQRSAAINKNTTTQAETLIAHRIIGPQDRDAIEEWIKFHGTKDERNVVMSELPHLQNGEAYIWSPEWLKILGRYMIRRRHTFDSAATPKVGEKRVEPKHLTAVDLEKLRGQLSTVIDKAKQDDPRELRKMLAESQRTNESLMQRIKDAEARPPTIQTITHEVDWDKLTQLWTEQLANPAIREAITVVPKPRESPAQIAKTFDVPERAVTAPENGPLPRSPRSRSDHLFLVDISQPQQRILDGLATLESMRVRVGAWSIVAMLGKQSPKSSGFEKNVSILRSRQLIEGGRAGLNLTEAGRKVAQWPAFKMTPTAIQGAVLAMISGPQQRMLNVLIERYPREVEWTYLADKSNQSPTSSGFEKNVSVLRSLGLVVGGRAGLSAAPVLFLEG